MAFVPRFKRRLLDQPSIDTDNFPGRPRSGGVPYMPTFGINGKMTNFDLVQTPNDDPLAMAFFGQNPLAAFFNRFGGAGGFGNRAEFIRGRFNPLYSQYQSQLPQNPNQTFLDFIQPFNLDQEFNSLAPRQRGENPGLYAPRTIFRGRRF